MATASHLSRSCFYYSIKYDDAWDAAKKIVPQIPGLETKTKKIVGAFVGSTYPRVVKEAALFNLANLRSQTAFRIPSGHLMGWEGVMNRSGSCWGSGTQVLNYEMATPFLFGNLARTMRGGHIMASWSAIMALSDFQFSGVSKSMSITSNPGRYFWSNGYAWGICEGTANAVKMELLHGALELRELAMQNLLLPLAV